MITEYNELWSDYIQDRSDENLNRLIKAYWRTIYAVFYRMFSKFEYNIDEYISYGSMGLVAAIQCYDVNEKRHFIPFAYGCIYRTMRDAWRKYDQPRQWHSRRKRLTKKQWQNFPAQSNPIKSLLNKELELYLRKLLRDDYNEDMYELMLEKYGWNRQFEEICAEHPGRWASEHSLKNVLWIRKKRAPEKII